MIRALVVLMSALAAGATITMSPVFGQSDQSSASGVTVRMHDLTFDPQSLKVQTGQTVTFENDDKVSHNVTGSEIGTSGDVGPGKSWKYTFDKAGDYHYVCTYHQGMAGEIIVTAGK